MKRIISKFLPIFFLLFALTFMTIFKHEDTLSDSEAYEFKSLSSIDHTIDKRAELESNLVNKEYRITSDAENVTVFDDEGNEVFQTSLTDWEENLNSYYDKYNLN